MYFVFGLRANQRMHFGGKASPMGGNIDRALISQADVTLNVLPPQGALVIDAAVILMV